MGGFSVSNLYLNPAGSFSPMPSPAPNDALPGWSDAPAWVQLLYGAKYLGGVLDPYIMTDQEKAQLEVERLRYLAAIEQAKAEQAGIKVEPQPTTPPWVWALVAAGAVVVVLLLVNRE